ncbi:hypothetical protein OBBRIDRAFT_507125 [Obba rivulosa]|uniref:DUF6534 domain-containing protein n=1 Tax=Obba rivulosa TaxID=1052685 RepID=A0A8E2AHX6_9APHY|nr:hypothetical protein OBBRIDRAFT_507125 [Obba rivulosa]
MLYPTRPSVIKEVAFQDRSLALCPLEVISRQDSFILATILFHLSNTLGALQISTMITSGIYGITLLQTYVYLHNKCNDPTSFKAAICFLWALDTLHQIFICNMAFTYTVTDFGNVLILTQETWAMIAIIIVSAFMHTGVRSLFCLRIWWLSGKNWMLVSIIMFCSLGELGTLLTFAVKNITVVHYQLFGLGALSSEFYAATILTIVSDSFIAISQVVLLLKRRSNVRRTDSMIRTLIVYSVNTGLLTTACALTLLITWATMPDSLIYDIFFSALPTLLFNALLATLNARKELREKAHGTAGLISLPLAPAAPTSSNISTQVSQFQDSQEAAFNAIEIKIERSEQIV